MTRYDARAWCRSEHLLDGPGRRRCRARIRPSGLCEVSAAAAAKYGPGDRLGPLISAEQRKEVESFLEPGAGGPDAILVTKPAVLPDKGHYVSPTVISRVDPDSRLAQEEVFGPVLAILAADSDEHAVEIANNSIYGLGGAVWGPEEAALEVAGRLRTGQVDVNGEAVQR